MKKLQDEYFHSRTGDDIIPQAILGGTGARPKDGGAHDQIFLRG